MKIRICRNFKPVILIIILKLGKELVKRIIAFHIIIIYGYTLRCALILKFSKQDLIKYEMQIVCIIIQIDNGVQIVLNGLLYMKYTLNLAIGIKIFYATKVL